MGKKIRLSASSAGAALGLNPYKKPSDLVRQMVRAYHDAEPEFTGNEATRYGQEKEPDARFDYVQKTANLIQEYGYCTNQGGWLSCIPDGLIRRDNSETSLVGSGLVSIKCPYSMRIDHHADFKPIAAMPHYYAQCQVEMYITQRQWTHFYQWGPLKDQLEVVHFDHDWWLDNFEKLEAFYEYFLSEIDNPEHLGPKIVEIDTHEAHRLLEKYDLISAKIKDLQDAKAQALDDLIELTGGKDGLICGRKLTQVTRKGAVQYGKIPELKKLDLEKYRGRESSFWKLS